MVSTRNHPSNFPPPDLSPTKASPSKRSTRSSSVKAEDNDDSMALTRPRARSIAMTWSHTPSQLTLLWLAISTPLVLWDAGYMLGRPHTMEGGKLYWPLYVPYKLYATIDYVYGLPGLTNGWGPAQGAGNLVEIVLYFVYLWITFAYGKKEDAAGRGAPTKSLSFGRRKIVGKEAGIAVLIGFAAAVMTFWKTVLYGAIEVFNGYESIGHNDWSTLVFLWIIPNGSWLVGSGYMIYLFGTEILQGLEIAGGLPYKKEI